MEQKTLLKVSLACSIFGLIVLFFISDNLEIAETNIESINLGQAGKYAKVFGVVREKIDTENVMILTITQPKNVQVVVFKDKDINLEQGQYIEIIGKIEEYEGKPEIIASRIRVIE